MYLVRSITPSRRVAALVLLVLAGAALLAMSLLEPPRTDTAPDTGGATGREHATGTAAPPSVEPRVGGDGESVVAPPADVESRGVATDAAIAPEGTTDLVSAPELDARIVRSATVELRVRRSGFEEAWGDAQAVAGSHGGYVVAASRSGAGDGPRAGTITMRIPTRRFDSAVERIRSVDGARVRRLDVASQDVTQEFVDVRSRLRHDRAVEARLLALLSQARGVGEVLAVQGRLDQVQEQVELGTGRMQYLEKMTSMSTVETTITARATRGARADDDARDGGVLSASLGDARDRLEANVAAVIVWFGGALPALVLMSIAVVVGRILWRRSHRQAATDSSETGSEQAFPS